MRIASSTIKHLTVLDKLEAMDDLDFERLSCKEISQLWRQLLGECTAWIAATEAERLCEKSATPNERFPVQHAASLMAMYSYGKKISSRARGQLRVGFSK